MKELYTPQVYDSVFQEDPQVQNARNTCKELIGVLEAAKGILQQVHEFQ